MNDHNDFSSTGLEIVTSTDEWSILFLALNTTDCHHHHHHHCHRNRQRQHNHQNHQDHQIIIGKQARAEKKAILGRNNKLKGKELEQQQHHRRHPNQMTYTETQAPPASSPSSLYERVSACATTDSIYLGGDGTPEAAANAMANTVRLILLILICVLLVKLRAPKQSSRYYSGRRSRQDEEDELSGSEKKTKTSYNYFSKSINLLTQSTNESRQLLTNCDQHQHQQQQQHEKPQQQGRVHRKSSLHELVSESRLLEKERERSSAGGRDDSERRRRHSDSCLAQLSLPPGPMGLPFLGYLPFVGNEIHLTLTSLSERYGPIYQIWLGGIRVVVLNEASLVRQAFKQPVFSGRPDTQLTRILQGYGIVNSYGALWKEQRAFLHTALRKLGAKSLMNGSNGLETKIQHQVREFVNDLSGNADSGKPCQVRPIVARAVSSVVGSIVMNLTYRKYEEKEKFDRLIELMQEGFRLFTIAMPLDFIPIFRFLPGVSYAYKKMKRNRAETSAFFQGVADEHRKYLSETFNLDSRSHNSPANSPLHPARSAADSASHPATGLSAAATAAQQLGQLPELELEQVAADMKQQQELSRATPDSNNSSSVATPLAASATATTTITTTTTTTTTTVESTPAQHVELEKIVARDLVDAYIVQQKKHEKDGKENYFSDQQLVQIMSDIFSAGLETVTSTIEWSILFLILNLECQEQIQQEIDRVIGRERMPQLEDLSQMAYTEATIYEVLRRSNVIALGNAHATLDDASIGGYRIPKGTQVLPNLYCIHMNPKLWHEPEKFEPQRFIVNDKAQKPDYFIPFSVGRRMCLGDVLAKMEVFLFLVGLLQKYDLSVPEEDRHCPPQIKGTIGVSTTPASYRVALRKRDNKPTTTTTTSATTTSPSGATQTPGDR